MTTQFRRLPLKNKRGKIKPVLEEVYTKGNFMREKFCSLIIMIAFLSCQTTPTTSGLSSTTNKVDQLPKPLLAEAEENCILNLMVNNDELTVVPIQGEKPLGKFNSVNFNLYVLSSPEDKTLTVVFLNPDEETPKELLNYQISQEVFTELAKYFDVIHRRHLVNKMEPEIFLPSESQYAKLARNNHF